MKKKLAMIALLNVLVACNDMQQSKPATSSITKYTATSVLLTGKTEVKSGNVEAIDRDQNVIAVAVVQNGRYQLEIPAQTKLPIVLRCEKLVAVVVDTDFTGYDINALTTAIAEKAKALGGYTRQNMIVAASNSVNTPDANKTSTGFRGDPTSQYGGWH
ncbi:MAG: hypothetical protein PHN45_12580 [Methylococcales bacterium]|nr:hypothetical protein [Methylococcales bacterium]MDD5755569.1 hypothetical protein [Methylococcales bacterium]